MPVPPPGDEESPWEPGPPGPRAPRRAPAPHDLSLLRRRLEMAGLTLVIALLSAVTVAVMSSRTVEVAPPLPFNWTLSNSCFLVLALLSAAILFSHGRDRALSPWERMAACVVAAIPVLLLVIALIHDLLFV